MLITLQQLQQSDPTEYQQLTGQISTNLRDRGAAASADGNTSEANQLNQLATDFSNASQSGQLPNVQDLAQSVGGGGHHRHHHSGDSSSDSTTTQTQAELTSSLFGNTTQNNPLAVILNTLSSAGIGNNSNG